MKGRLRTIQRPGNTVTYNYDRFGRVTTDGAMTYQYDGNGNRTRITYPLGLAASPTYDYADRPVTLTLRPPMAASQLLVTGATYEPLGPLASVTFANGLSEARDHDTRYAPTGIALGTLLDWDYTTDAVGNVTAIADALTPASSRTFAYQDVQYFLACAAGPWNAAGADCLPVPPTGQPLQWSYDRIGNRLTEVRAGQTRTYNYATNGAGGHSPKLNTITGPGGTTSYVYDAAGDETRRNMTGQPSLRLTYDATRAVQRLDPMATFPKTTIKYDGRGYLRSSLFEPDAAVDQTTAPAYGSEGLLFHTSFTQVGGTPPPVHHRYVVYLGGRPAAIYEGDQSGSILVNTTLRYVTTDHLGTPVAATDSAGALTWQGGFEPFGQDYAGAQGAGVFLRLPGQWQDASWENASFSSKIYYNVHRWYEGGTGRYTRTDPLGLRGSWHPYTYAKGRPLRYVDRLGLKECGAEPSKADHPDCLEFCDVQKEWGECRLDKQLKAIGAAGVGLAAILGVTAGFEGGPLAGCLVGGGVLAIDLGVHHAWHSFGGGAVALTYNKCRQTCCLGGPAAPSAPAPGDGVCPGI